MGRNGNRKIWEEMGMEKNGKKWEWEKNEKK